MVEDLIYEKISQLLIDAGPSDARQIIARASFLLKATEVAMNLITSMTLVFLTSLIPMVAQLEI